MSDTKLTFFLACPFCGKVPNEPRRAGYAKGLEVWRIECKYAPCPAILVVFGRTKEDARDKWNSRAESDLKQTQK